MEKPLAEKIEAQSNSTEGDANAYQSRSESKHDERYPEYANQKLSIRRTWLMT